MDQKTSKRIGLKPIHRIPGILIQLVDYERIKLLNPDKSIENFLIDAQTQTILNGITISNRFTTNMFWALVPNHMLNLWVVSIEILWIESTLWIDSSLNGSEL